MIRLAAAALLGTLLALTVKKEAPEQGMLLALGCGTILLLMLLEPLREALRCWDRLAARIAPADEIAGPLLKVVGISIVARFAASFCRDGGQSALAAKVELGGAAACLAAAMPLMETTLEAPYPACLCWDRWTRYDAEWDSDVSYLRGNVEENGTVRTMNVCTRCLRTMRKVEKA